MPYELQEPKQPWSWRRMLAGFNDATLERIVGPGVRRIVCMAIAGSYDHKRHHAARMAQRPYPPNAPVPVWDFVVERTDGTRVRFHVGQTKRKVEIADYDFALERDGPAAGRGQSDGPGTYRAMLANTHNEVGAVQPTAAERQANRERARGRGRHTRGGSAHIRGGGGGCCHGSAPAAAQCLARAAAQCSAWRIHPRWRGGCHGSAPAAAQCCDSAAAWARRFHCHVLAAAAACWPASSGGCNCRARAAAACCPASSGCEPAASCPSLDF